MSRWLTTTVQAGPFVFPAGTAETDIDPDIAKGISPTLWEGGDGGDVTVSLVDLPEVQQALQAAETKLGEADGIIADLRARVAELEAELEAERARTPQATDGGAGPQVGAYDGLDIDALKAEIDKRNEDREQDDRISKRGSAETLVAALVADDQREG